DDTEEWDQVVPKVVPDNALSLPPDIEECQLHFQPLVLLLFNSYSPSHNSHLTGIELTLQSNSAI
ncbi:hypothetical protein SK128_020250, partial [Halocaridina rubra]